MSWDLEVSPEFERDYRKVCSRNAGFKRAVDAKVNQIRENPSVSNHYMRRSSGCGGSLSGARSSYCSSRSRPGIPSDFCAWRIMMKPTESDERDPHSEPWGIVLSPEFGP